ncbi:MAG: 30S ribosomal protein S20 [Bacteroidia bacterium]|nr:30S ribosomal protein S20 [Bacteroidales bacterium]NCD40522.1 30S ribosomal protein S20 [Bacteroidia bacterium]MDD2322011.1 30S ribosomal protein S20 [Bacteroidales bacterium]MDD3009967.1 30S ribosomal protein S20 [Bacteroidales bacterium]MDD3960823.1 30S ribosomal protein S20 [Bacteroidales bacterium]
MANHKSSIKRIRQTKVRRLRNRYYGRTMRSAVKKFRLLDNKEEATKNLPGMYKLIDKMVKRGMIHKNKAGNIKSSLTKQVNALA